MERHPPARVDDLLAGLFEKTLTEAQWGEARELLREDEAAREQYIVHAMTHALLGDTLRGETDAEALDDAVDSAMDSGILREALELEAEASERRKHQEQLRREAEQHEQQERQDNILSLLGGAGETEPPVRHIVIPKVVVYAGIAALVALMAMLFWPHTDAPTSDAAGQVAVLEEVVDAVWEDGVPLAAGAKLHQGRYRLREGLVRLKYDSGASVIIEGPAAFSLDSGRALTLTSGSLVGLCPTPAAHGFTVTAPNARLVDLGTEFGIAVLNDGRTEAEVFTGSIRMSPIAAANIPQVQPVVLGAGRTCAVPGDGSRVNLDVPMTTRFVRNDGFNSRALAMREMARWANYRDALREDRSLIGFYAFEPGQTNVGRVINWGSLGIGADAELSGGVVREPGRRQGLGAIRIDSVDDVARFEMSAPMPAVTMAMWVRVDEAPGHNGVSLVSSRDLNQSGRVHWIIDRFGNMAVYAQVHQEPGVRVKQINFISAERLLTPRDYGRWIHVAIAIDTQQRQARFWRDGEPLKLSDMNVWPAIEKTLPVRLGVAEIGNYTGPGNAGRVLKGAIGELLVFKRALDDREMRELYHRSRQLK